MRRLIRWAPLLAAIPILPLAAVVAAGGPAIHAEATSVGATGATVGWAKLVEDGAGRVHVNVHVAGLTPGRHGIHIHAAGACTPTFADALGHYNPIGRQHGLANPNGAHAGDLPNLEVNGNGVGRLQATTDRVTLRGGTATLFDANGSAFIIHANEDDQVTDANNGNSGARIACAVIRLVEPTPD
jgi:Cu-Zn family superoxide dismutase